MPDAGRRDPPARVEAPTAGQRLTGAEDEPGDRAADQRSEWRCRHGRRPRCRPSRRWGRPGSQPSTAATCGWEWVEVYRIGS